MTDSEKLIYAAAFAAAYCDQKRAYGAMELATTAYNAVICFKAAELELEETPDIDVLKMLRAFMED